MQRFTLLCLFLLWQVAGNAQIMGIAASKLSALNAAPIAKQTAEFEPTFGYARSGGMWNDMGYTRSDSVEVSGSINWRVSYGVSEHLELGLNVLSDASFGNFSAKVKCYEEGPFALSAMGGIGVPLGSRQYRRSAPSVDDVSNYGLGIILSYQIDSLNSVDLNVQYQDYFKKIYREVTPMMTAIPLTSKLLFVNVDAGSYSFHKNLQLMFGGGYQSTLGSDNRSANLFLESGLALEYSERYAIAVAIMQSVWGKNSSNTTGICVAFTTFWD